MTDTRTQRLKDAIRRRSTCQEQVQRIRGRLAAALEERSRIERECRERGVEPDRLDEALQQLEERFDTMMDEFETDIATAEKKLAPFGGDIS